MGFLDRLWRKANEDLIAVLRQGIADLRLGLFGKLFNRYKRTFGEKKAAFFSVAIVNEVVDESPTNQNALEFLEENWVLVESEAGHLVDDPELAKVMSYLYAAQIMELSIQTGNADSPRSNELLERATKLGVYLPNTYDICGTGNHEEAAIVIARFARSFAEANVIEGPVNLT